MRFRVFSLIAILAAFGLVLSSCLTGAPAPARPSRRDRPFTVAAAANLKFALDELGQKFREKTGTEAVFTYGSTKTLAKQIDNGAPIDLFIAADTASVEDLKNKDRLIPDTRQAYAVGRIVLASSRNAGINIPDLPSLLDPRVKRVAIANPGHAPYGAAAREALIGAGIWDRVQPKLVYGEDIRQTLSFIQTGNAEAGIIALSVAEVPEISYKLIDRTAHSPLKQSLAAVKGSPFETEARRFISFITGSDGRTILEKYGYEAPPDTDGQPAGQP